MIASILATLLLAQAAPHATQAPHAQGTARKAAPKQSAKASGCDDATTQAEMNRCAGEDYKAADAALNAQYRRTMAAMKARDDADTSRGGGFGYAAALQMAQRNWLKFRDSQCTLEAGLYAGGSIQPLIRAGCLAQVTRTRTQQLAQLVQD